MPSFVYGQQDFAAAPDWGEYKFLNGYTCITIRADGQPIVVGGSAASTLILSSCPVLASNGAATVKGCGLHSPIDTLLVGGGGTIVSTSGGKPMAPFSNEVVFDDTGTEFSGPSCQSAELRARVIDSYSFLDKR